MQACVNGLFFGLSAKLIENGDRILMQTDCQGAIDAFNHRRTRLLEHEKQAKHKLSKLIKDNNLTIKFKHVKGHTSRSEARYVTNNLCDMRAKKGMRQARAAIKHAHTPT
jgi:ribonuclease HI